ncbi:RNA-directed DNA polymerase [Cellulomonas sp. McL0617]|uniref:RNA-directed DNA polymerase n=1 Tax=Cellulomonas sp. McL0617 TaxID=3415675 RepID=UPI003CF8E20C
MTLEDRVLYRALVTALAGSLPAHLSSRPRIADFHRAPLDVPDVAYVTKTDVTSYYEFVDHDILAEQLIAQTGDEVVVNSLVELLSAMMGRGVGLPQVHASSDILGDTYIDPVRRRMRRSGVETFTYADDFRIATSSLGGARKAVELCASEARAIGLVLNERKTYTYGADNYRSSLTSFADAEERLFVDSDHSAIDLSLLLESDYTEDDEIFEVAEDDATFEIAEDGATTTLGPTPLAGEIDDDDAIANDSEALDALNEAARARAAARAWQLWLEEDESEEAQSRRTAAITQSLLGRALPMLGRAGDTGPLHNLEPLIRFEPALTPQIAAYLESYAQIGTSERASVRSALDEIAGHELLSNWQALWLVDAAGSVRGSRPSRRHLEWLSECVVSGSDAVAATAAASLGRLQRGDGHLIKERLDRLGEEWRQLALWGLGQLEIGLARDAAEHELDRILLTPETT